MTRLRADQRVREVVTRVRQTGHRFAATRIIAVIAVVVGAGCSSPVSPATPTPQQATPSQNPTVSPSPRTPASGSQIVVRETSTDGYMEAVTNGTLAIVNGCVVIVRGGEPITPVFNPGDAEWDGAVLTLIPSRRKLQLGAEVRLSGGQGTEKNETLPLGCPPHVWAVNPL